MGQEGALAIDARRPCSPLRMLLRLVSFPLRIRGQDVGGHYQHDSLQRPFHPVGSCFNLNPMTMCIVFYMGKYVLDFLLQPFHVVPTRLT